MAEVTRHLIISGRVQGVGYRAWTEREAQKIGLNGWVRNRENGSVEALLQGSQSQVDQLIEKARSGPLLAKVKDIAIEEGSYDGKAGFQILPTV